MADGYIAVNLRRHDDAAIAKITVTDETTSTGLVTDDLVDLYHADFDDTNGEYEEFLYQVALPDLTHTYSITVEHSGSHNPSCAGSDYTVEYGSPFRTDKLTSATVQTTLTTWHTSYTFDVATYTLTPNVVTSLAKTQAFNGDGITKVFTLPSSYHASSFDSYSDDGGTTWKYPTSIDIDWGSNSPAYDNETIDSSGNFSINFFTAPATGTGNIIIKYIPMVNKYKIRREIQLPYDGSYIDSRAEVRLLNDALELI